MGRLQDPVTRHLEDQMMARSGDVCRTLLKHDF